MRVRRESRQLLLQLGGVALWALGFLVAKHNSFEVVAAFGANIFKDGNENPCDA